MYPTASAAFLTDKYIMIGLSDKSLRFYDSHDYFLVSKLELTNTARAITDYDF